MHGPDPMSGVIPLTPAAAAEMEQAKAIGRSKRRRRVSSDRYQDRCVGCGVTFTEVVTTHRRVCCLPCRRKARGGKRNRRLMAREQRLAQVGA